MNRKISAAGLGLIATCLLGSDPAASQTRVRYNNGWLFGGAQAYAPLAQDRGCFTREKLEVSMDRGFGSTDTVTKIAAGAYDIGEADFNTMSQFNATNPESRLIAIFMMGDEQASAIVTMKGSGITKPQDLVGKSIGDSVGETSRVLFPAFAAANKFDANAVNWVNTASNLREQLLVQKRADAIAGHMFTLKTGLLALGVKYDETTVIRYADWGVKLYGAALVANAGWLATHEEATKGFVRCIAEALKMEFIDPKAALAASKARNSMMDDALELDNLMFTDSLILTEYVRKNGMSAVSRERMERTLKQVTDAMGIPTPTVEQVWTDKYLPAASMLNVDGIAAPH